MEWVTICLSSELNCTQSLVIYVCFFLHTPFFTRQINDSTFGGIFWLSFMSKNNPLYKYHRCFNLFWICHVKNIMQCYHNSKSMDKVYTSTHRDVLNFNMKNTFLIRQHTIWRKSTPPTTIRGWLWAAFSKK